jgi:hypothetical protein
MPNLRSKTWTTTTPANVEDAQYWEDHLISDADALKITTSVQSVNNTTPDAQGNVDIVALPSGGTAGQVLTKQSSTEGDADWEDPASSGHTIIDENGDDMPYRTNLQFTNAEVTDDSVNDVTIVDCKGSKGDPGQAATITIGTTTTLPAGSSATVTNSGTASAAVFNFGIPKGADGTGAGDMLKADYDPNSVVELAGGIPDYVASQAYTLPTAASNVLGGVKVGTNLSIDASGVLSATDTNTDELKDLTDVNLTTPTDGQALLYDNASSKWVNGNVASGSGGSIITVTTTDSSLYGQTVTITDGTTTLTETLSNTGEATFEGVTLTGSLTVSTTGATPYALSAPYYGNYSVVLSAFSATITITYPSSLGATCTLTDGATTLTGTGSPMAFSIPNTGTWVATCTLDGQSKTQSFVITTDGQTESHTFEYGTINLTFDNEFRGLTITCANGGTVISKTAPISGNTMAFYPPSTGEWIISATYSGVPYSTSATVVSLATAVSAILQTLPNGQTVLPTDDIQTWLKCAGINNKTSYTTLADVLGDSTTLLALMSHNNAVDYLVRSKSWTTAKSLIPVMTSNTTPSGVASAKTTLSGYDAYKAFDNDSSTRYANNVEGIADEYLRYQFASACSCKFANLTLMGLSGATAVYKIRGSVDGNTWTDLANVSHTFSATNVAETISGIALNHSDTAYLYFELLGVSNTSTMRMVVVSFELCLTSEAQGICDNATAMTDIGANDYCANTLLADSTWCSAICNSTYFESVLNKKVPTMTSDTTPSGTVSVSGNYSPYYAWKAFNPSESVGWLNNNVPNHLHIGNYVNYDFGYSVKVYVICAVLKNYNQNVANVKGKIQAYDGANWVDITNEITISANSTDAYTKYIASKNISNYSKYQFVCTSEASTNNMSGLKLQFYGR